MSRFAVCIRLVEVGRGMTVITMSDNQLVRLQVLISVDCLTTIYRECYETDCGSDRYFPAEFDD